MIFADDARWVFLLLCMGTALFAWHSTYARPFQVDMLVSIAVWIVYLPIRSGLRRRKSASIVRLVVWMDMVTIVLNMYLWKYMIDSVMVLASIVVWEAVWSLTLMEALYLALALGVGLVGVSVAPPVYAAELLSCTFVAPFYLLLVVLTHFLKYRLLRMEQDSTQDFLTGLANRRRIQDVYSHQQRAGVRLWMVLLDIDNFKQINDTEGHVFGDEVLKGIAGCLQEEFSECGWVSRFGGEEFLVLIPETVCEVTLKRQLNRLSNRVDAAFNGAPVRVTLSGGVTSARTVGEPLVVALTRADQLLYKAKKSGKNKVDWEESQCANG